MLKKFEIINSNNWHDYYLDSINIDYDKAILSIHLNEKIIHFECRNFIGISYLGQWDECVIEDITISDNTELISIAKRNIAKGNCISIPGGGTRNFNDVFLDFCVTLLDSITIDIICTDIQVQIQHE